MTAKKTTAATKVTIGTSAAKKGAIPTVQLNIAVTAKAPPAQKARTPKATTTPVIQPVVPIQPVQPVAAVPPVSPPTQVPPTTTPPGTPSPTAQHQQPPLFAPRNRSGAWAFAAAAIVLLACGCCSTVVFNNSHNRQQALLLQNQATESQAKAAAAEKAANDAKQANELLQQQLAAQAAAQKAAQAPVPTAPTPAPDRPHGNSPTQSANNSAQVNGTSTSGSGTSFAFSTGETGVTDVHVHVKKSGDDRDESARNQAAEELRKDIAQLKKEIKHTERDLAGCKSEARNSYNSGPLGPAVLRQAEKDAESDESALAEMRLRLREKTAELTALQQ